MCNPSEDGAGIDLAFVSARPAGVNFIAIDPAEAAALIEARLLGQAKTDTSDGLLSAGEVLEGSQAYVAFQRGVPLVLVVLRVAEYGRGRELEIRAAIALSTRRDATETVLPAIEATFGAGCQSVAVHTRRGGLVKKLQAAGYVEAAKILRKTTRV